MTEQWTPEVFRQVSDGILAANREYTPYLPDEWTKRVERRAEELNQTLALRAAANINIVIFHVKIPATAGSVQAPDIKNLDHSNVDYETLIRLNILIAQRTNPRSKVILLTDKSFLAGQKESPRLAIHRLDVNGAEPMFERVWTMASYIHSKLFDAPTVFLDSDAFLLRPMHDIFANDFDVAFTYRDIVGQMPINEGVIFANNVAQKRVSKLFNAYLASYLALEASPKIEKIYKNIRRWRGGQLAINSIGQGGLVYSRECTVHPTGARVAFLPCSKYNLSQIEEYEVTAELRRRCAVLHLKGPRKSWVNRITKLLAV